MAKLRPIGLSKEDQEEPHTRIIPDRLLMWSRVILKITKQKRNNDR